MSNQVLEIQKEDVILLIEPDSETRVRRAQLLRDEGWTVVESDGTDLPVARIPLDPILILITGGRGGFDETVCIQKLRSDSSTERTPIVVLADSSPDGLAIEALKEGANDIAVGPFGEGRLAARVKAHAILARLGREEGHRIPKAFEQLRLSERRYRSLAIATAAIVFIAEWDGQVVEESPTWEGFTGQSYSQYRGFGWITAIHPEDRPLIRKRMSD